ncbi:hypothetical protein [Pelomonas sp. KK5]|uniref:hypothetical protein n=1 Tax=Pelomonas sp. KK5 TaxID=1855730 RepID=UPI0011808D1A|nr:hypothetical protein [Pelomonas sp. KK5]
MKALKSPLAKQILANPHTRGQLRQVTAEVGAEGTTRSYIEVKQGSSTTTQRYVARVVPKAA